MFLAKTTISQYIGLNLPVIYTHQNMNGKPLKALIKELSERGTKKGKKNGLCKQEETG